MKRALKLSVETLTVPLHFPLKYPARDEEGIETFNRRLFKNIDHIVEATRPDEEGIETFLNLFLFNF